MHLPEDVSIRISDHNGTRFELLYSLWGDWIHAIGDPDKPDEIYNCMLDAGDALQGAHFNFLHGYYRVALAELRVALELVLIGTFGNLQPTDAKYCAWKQGLGELDFTRCRKNLSGALRKDQAKWMFANGEFLAETYKTLCNYTHSRPDANYGVLWQSNGPVYNNEAIRLTFFTTLSVFAICYLFVRIARPGFTMPKDSDILFELDGMPHYAKLALLWQILRRRGFPNQFFCDSWEVGFWRGRPWLTEFRTGRRSLQPFSSRFWLDWVTRRGGKCVRSTYRD